MAGSIDIVARLLLVHQLEPFLDVVGHVAFESTAQEPVVAPVKVCVVVLELAIR